MAREMQRQLEEEEERLRADEEMARRLQEEEEGRDRPDGAPTSSQLIYQQQVTHFPATTNNTPSQGACPLVDDAELARALQERYYQRFNRSRNRLVDENVQNEVVSDCMCLFIISHPPSVYQLTPTLVECYGCG